MPLFIVRNDITKMPVDAIVNAANTALEMGGGVCGAIFKAAGVELLQAACDKLAPIQVGDAIITPGFELTARYIIHTAGPVYRGGKHGEEKLLRSCYINSLKRAVENRCKSVAFPLISSGIYGYPKEEALKAATSAIRDFLGGHDLQVSLVVFDRAALAASRELLGHVREYIEENFEDDYRPLRHRDLLQVEEEALGAAEAEPLETYEWAFVPLTGIDELTRNLDEPFAETLLRLIDAKGRTDVEVYKRANLDRRLFSKIRSQKGYMPSKRTAIALAVALKLSLEETDDLLRRAGYALSHSRKFDVIVEYFIINGRYDIFEINEVLFSYDQPLLGG